MSVIAGLAALGVGYLTVGIAAISSQPNVDVRSTASLAAVLCFLIAAGLYYWFGNAFGGTPGKRLLGLRVLRVNDEQDLGVIRGFVRFVVWLVSINIGWIGLLVVAFSTQKRALHDYVAGSMVVRSQGLRTAAHSPMVVQPHSEPKRQRSARRYMKYTSISLASLAVLAVGGGAVFGVIAWRLDESPQALIADLSSSGTSCNNESAAVEKVLPSVVQVLTAESSGTGVVLTNGKVLTAFHVVNGYQTADIVAQGKKKGQASVRYVDETTDLALLDIDVDLPSLEWSKAEPAVGSRVLALGFPFASEVGADAEASVTSGLVSRYVDFGSIRYIQTDAALNPGNSGGPLVDLCGRLLGINVLRALEKLQAEGTGFAVAEESARSSVDSMVQRAESYHPAKSPPVANLLAYAAGDCVAFKGESGSRALCSGAHDATVIATYEMAAGAYPGITQIRSFANNTCPAASDWYLFPTEQEWASGYRQIVCLNGN